MESRFSVFSCKRTVFQERKKLDGPKLFEVKLSRTPGYHESWKVITVQKTELTSNLKNEFSK